MDKLSPITGQVADSASTNDPRPSFLGSRAEAGAAVTLFDGGRVLGTAVVAADGSWQLSPKVDLADGKHRVNYTLSDVAGNQSAVSKSIEFKVDTTAPNAPAAVLAVVSDSGAQGDSTTSDTTA